MKTVSFLSFLGSFAPIGLCVADAKAPKEKDQEGIETMKARYDLLMKFIRG